MEAAAGVDDATPGARLSVAAVARRLGIAPATLRTWDRRYGLGPGEHLAGAHRRYRPEDVDRLVAMRRLTLDGVPPAEAARLALLATSGRSGGAAEAPASAAPLAAVDGHLAPVEGVAAGVEADADLALPGADAAVRGLGRAAMALDAQAVTALLRRRLEQHGVTSTWEHVLRPVLVAVGERWAATGQGIDVEHLLSDCASATLREIAGTATDPPGRRSVLLACAPDEWHSLPLSALAAGLAERGVATRTLGPAPRPRPWRPRCVAPGRRCCSCGPSCPPRRTRRCWSSCRSPVHRPARHRRPRLGGRPAAEPGEPRGGPVAGGRAGDQGRRRLSRPRPSLHRAAALACAGDRRR